MKIIKNGLFVDEFDRAYVADLQRISDQRATNLMEAWDRNAELQAEIEKIKADHAALIAEYDAMIMEMVKTARLLTATRDAVQSVKCQSDKDWLVEQLRDLLAQHEPTWI